MEAILSHPQLAEVQSIELVCQPELVRFYRRWASPTKLDSLRYYAKARTLHRSLDIH
jgi:hypothetical protein